MRIQHFEINEDGDILEDPQMWTGSACGTGCPSPIQCPEQVIPSWRLHFFRRCYEVRSLR